VELIRKTIRIPQDLNKRMKHATIDLGMTEQELVTKAIEEYLRKGERE
jgi:predicted DNA-binding protein